MTKCYCMLFWNMWWIPKECRNVLEIGLPTRALAKKRGIIDTFHYRLRNKGEIWELNLGGGERAWVFQKTDWKNSGTEIHARSVQLPPSLWSIVASPKIPLGAILSGRSPPGPVRGWRRWFRLFCKEFFVFGVMRSICHGIRSLWEDSFALEFQILCKEPSGRSGYLRT